MTLQPSDYQLPFQQLLLKRGGLMEMKSHLLNETIYFALDSEHAKRAPVGSTTYTLHELKVLFSNKPYLQTPESVKRIHRAKQAFGLTFIDTPELNNLPAVDPRPDLPEDSFMWEQLIYLAQSDQTVVQLLFALRCHGMRLMRGKNNWVMRPEIRPDCFESQQEYEDVKNRWLVPNTKQITKYLKMLPV
jgi:hypothetical protein